MIDQGPDIWNDSGPYLMDKRSVTVLIFEPTDQEIMSISMKFLTIFYLDISNKG